MAPRSSLLVVFVALLLGVPASGVAQFRAVVLPGDPIPDRPGEVVDTVREIVLLGGDAAAVVVRNTDGAAALLRDDAGVQTLIAHAGDPAPGGGTFDTLGVLYGAGQHVVFLASIGGVRTVFSWDGSTTRRVIGEGDPLPGTSRTLGFILQATASDLGEIVVHATADVYYEAANGAAATTVLSPLDPVPGDAGFGVELVEHAEISTGGVLSIVCSGTNAARSIFRRYVLQGSSTALAPVASTLDTPAASGDFAFHAVSRSGAIAYEYVYTTSDAGPTVEHRELWIESAGSAARVLELVGETTFPVDDRFVRWGFTSARLSDGLRLFVHGGMDAVTGAPSVLSVLGTEWDVVHRDDQPLPGGGVQMTSLAGASAAGEGLLSAGVGETSGLYLWSSAGGLGLLARPGDVLEGSSMAITGVGGGSIGGDGRVAFGASYADASGGTVVGAFMTGESAAAETDLRALRLEAEMVTDAGIADLVQLVLTVENAGPSPAAFEARIVSSSDPLAEPSGCSVPVGGCTCAGNTCTTDRAVPVRDTVAMVIAYDRTASRNVVVTVMPIGATERMPADNEIRLGAGAGGGTGGCSVAHGARAPATGLWALGLALFLITRRAPRRSLGA